MESKTHSKIQNNLIKSCATKSSGRIDSELSTELGRVSYRFFFREGEEVCYNVNIIILMFVIMLIVLYKC